ncbi:LysE family transporter [Photobacterium sp. 2_MG-2023]|uniref:LysE family translocator n=1 Tax=unclassified Photobacterium TaxID=2628852 RepID=UPI001C43F03F|nr:MULTISPECIES: LysE family transporter [unclassified Photobacterium]MBV7263044.1 LysE family transporter [Photobacterium sp. WH24]MDO6583092.1 LysE family transporter [Photobacterium sp. 2_MG-2023]
MQSYVFLLPILALLTLGAMTPGPSFLLVAQTAMSHSRTQAFSVALGMGTGALIFALLASFGLVTLFETVPELYLTFKLLGGLYLCVLACRIWKQGEQPRVQAVAAGKTQSVHSSFFYGLTTQLSNPKTAMVFSSVFAALLPAEVPSLTPILLSLGVFLTNFGWYAIVAVLLSTERAQNLYLKAKKGFCRVAGTLLGLFGAKLLMSTSADL